MFLCILSPAITHSCRQGAPARGHRRPRARRRWRPWTRSRSCTSGPRANCSSLKRFGAVSMRGRNWQHCPTLPDSSGVTLCTSGETGHKTNWLRSRECVKRPFWAPNLQERYDPVCKRTRATEAFEALQADLQAHERSTMQTKLRNHKGRIHG